jgi:hypothetical protein
MTAGPTKRNAQKWTTGRQMRAILTFVETPLRGFLFPEFGEALKLIRRVKRNDRGQM